MPKEFPIEEQPVLSVCVVSYNTSELTVQTLQSLAESATKLTDTLEVIIVDNASQDDSVQQIDHWIRSQDVVRARLITLQENRGFGAANNLGLSHARGTFFLLLNSDTIVTASALTELLSAIRQHPTAILVSELEYPSGAQQPQGGDLPTLLSVAAQFLFLDEVPVLKRLLPSAQHTGRTRSSYPSASTSEPQIRWQGWVAATALMISRTSWNTLGGFSDAIFLYGEDVELCIRAAKHDLPRGVVTTARITHVQNASSNSTTALTGEIKGLYRIWALHFPIWQTPLLSLLLRLGVLARRALFATIGDTQKATQYAEVYSQVWSDET